MSIHDPITILHEQHTWQPVRARVVDEQLWLSRADVEPATGWAWKPEGLCRGETCIPLSGPATRAMLGDDDSIDIAAIWRYLGHPVVHDDARRTWVLGVGAEERAANLSSLEALDFTLPDLQGKPHRLSDYRGQKVLLATWASW